MYCMHLPYVYFQTFLSDLLKLIFDHLHPEAAFSSRTSSLELLNALLTAFSTKCPHQVSYKNEYENFNFF